MRWRAESSNSELDVTCPDSEHFLKELRAQGYKLFDNTDKPFNLNIVGWRYKHGRVNRYDDFIALYYKIGDFWKEVSWRATTRPGLPYLKNPINSRGAAILCPGQYRNSYAIGAHKGRYEALIQVGKVRVYRDNNYDGKIDLTEASIDEGYFGMNIHRGGLLDTYVNKNSAGCQVFQSREGFETFMQYVRSASKYWGKTFTYTLLEF